MIRKALFFVSLTVFTQNLFAAIDIFKPYKPMAAQGTIPEDFTTFTIEKILNEEVNHGDEFESLSRKNQRFFLKAIHQGIDEILRSGKVLYGDPLTTYINALGQKIIGSDPDLQNLRFYTLKSNVVNAFSTNQGIIFVSEGLIAQVENEAQLAFVLAHEIGHYIEKHVIIGFKERLELFESRSSNLTEKIKRLSIYSKDKEYEADRVGIRLYNEAGYNLDELFGVFDLLSFAYLPFKLKEVPVDYFNTDKLFVPHSFFKDEFPKVSPYDDYDDSKSSHPNIKSRRQQLQGEVKKYNKWKDITNLTKLEEFEYIRSLARFELVRNNLYEFDYIASLYNLFLLEDKESDNIHFQRYAAQSWYGLMLFKSSGKFTDILMSLNRIQGEQHQMHHVLRSMNRRQLATVGLRKIYDIRKEFPNDEVIEAVYDKAVKVFASDKKTKLNKFHDVSYYEAVGDSILNADLTDIERIRLSQDRKKLGLTTDGKIDDRDFHLFAIPDVINDEEFSSLFRKYAKEATDEEEAEDVLDGLSRKKRIKVINAAKKKQLQVGVDHLILLEPRAFAVNTWNMDIIGSEQLEINLKTAFDNLKIDFMKVHKVGSKEFKNADEEIYNERAVLMNVLMQLAEYGDLGVFPVDYLLINEMRAKYGTDKVAFLVLEHDRAPFRQITSALTLFAPIVSIRQRAKQHTTELTVILFDLKEYAVDGVGYIETPTKPTSIVLEAMVYDVLRTMNMPKSN